jgi:alcohol dehydrogenase (cytochrome c)
MATAGGLVFGGSNEGDLYALDATSGEPLWDFQAGGAARSNPMSFGLDGKQYVVIPAGQVVYVFGLAPGA